MDWGKFTIDKYKWTDNSDLIFSNWAKGSPRNKTENICVEMLSDRTAGEWVDEPCLKKNLIVCQKIQIWSLSRLQEVRLEVRKSVVPIGFIYVQLPAQPEPKSLWPTVEWKDVTSEYAGLFFRAEGGDSAKYGQLQNDNFPRLTDIQVGSPNGEIDKISLVPGKWSNYLLTGANTGPFLSTRFLVSSGEVRPRNKAMRIWKRTL